MKPTIIFIVKQMENLTAYDTFNEENHFGPTNTVQEEFGFLTEGEAMSFYIKAKNSLRFAGTAGMYYSYPVGIEIQAKNYLVIDLKLPDDVYVDGFMCPAKKIVCPSCDGDGTMVNPNVDSHGISQDEFDRDPDFKESYFRGDYDVKCDTCKGEKIVLDPEIDKLPKNLVEAYWARIKEKSECDAESVAERKHFSR